MTNQNYFLKLVLIVSSSLVLAGCLSSGNGSHETISFPPSPPIIQEVERSVEKGNSLIPADQVKEDRDKEEKND